MISRLTLRYRENQNFKLVIPAGLQDENGRKLSNQASFPLVVKTSDFPPLAKFSGTFGIVEANVKPVLLPATLRNLEAQVIAQKLAPTDVRGSSLKLDGSNFPLVVKWMRSLDAKENLANGLVDRDRSIFKDITQGVPKSFNVPLKTNGKAFEVVGIPLDGPGFYVVELQSRLLGRTLLNKEASMYVPTGALVTNMVVHTKWGRENSLFWVTALDSGAPIAGAQVAIYDCSGKAVASNLVTDASGIAKIDGNLRQRMNDRSCRHEVNYDRKAAVPLNEAYSKYDQGFFVSASKDKDFTFTHSGWNEGIQNYNFGFGYSTPDDASDPNIAHTVLDRTLFRAGETVSMKNFMRVHTVKGVALAPPADLPSKIVIANDDGSASYTIDNLKWDANDTSTAQFAIPKDAKLGRYTVTLMTMVGQSVKASYSPTSFQVMEFKIPLMKGLITFQQKGQTLVQPGKIDTQVSVQYQDGGPVPNKAVNFRYTISNAYGVRYANYPEMTFGLGRTVESHGRDQNQSEAPDKTIEYPTKLNSKGAGTVTIPGLSGLDQVKVVSAQLEFTDANSEAQNVTRTLNVFPANQLVAFSDSVATDKQAMKFKVAVVDLKGQPVVGATPSFQLFERIRFTHKTMMVGGFYQSETFVDVNPVSTAFTCQGVTDKRGFVSCQTKSPAPGEYIVQAEVRDAAGNSAYASSTAFVNGSRREWYPSDNNDRMDLVSDKPQAQSGQTAQFTVKMPFDQANVLVTVEREGILDAFVVPALSSKDPVIKLPIKASYSPNVYVSALAVRGRIAGSGADETSTVDLGKPAYKMGMTSLNVDWKDHKLNVDIKASKSAYKPRETASVTVTITDSAGAPVPNAEFALAVVDKGLLDLSKNGTWNILQAMMGNRELSVATATAQMQVIGKRHYGIKAKPTGGDGGSAPTRELFDTLLKWEARVTTNAAGQATYSFPMNDSLTAFKVVAVASSGSSKFGTGDVDIISQQDIVIQPAVSQLARNGDTYSAQFTLRNTTGTEQSVMLNGRVTFTYADGHTSTLDLPGRKVTLAANDSEYLTVGDVQVPDNVVGIKMGLAAQDSSKTGIIDACVDKNAVAVDKICLSQSVQAPVSVRTWMAQLSQIDANLRPTPVSVPKEALPGKGGVKVTLLPSLTGGLATVQDYLLNYPYISLEYLVSSAVARADQSTWNIAMKKLPAYLDADGLVMYYPSATSSLGSDVLTAYILSVANYSGYAIPSDTQTKMIAALKNVVQGRGRSIRGRAETPVETYIRRVNAIEVLARYNEAQAAWLTSLPAVAPEQVPTSSLVNLLSIYGTLKTAPDRVAKAASVQSALQARLTRVGTGLKLTPTNADSEFCWFCMTSTDTDQLRLILVVTKNDIVAGNWSKDDVQALVQASIGMMKRGAWDLTVADAYGVLGMKAFSTRYEKQTVTGLTSVSFPPAPAQSLDWNTTPKGGVLNFGLPAPGDYVVDASHQGTGNPWSIVALNAAVPLLAKVENHISIDKVLSPAKSVYKVGDVVTVTLTIKAQTNLNQVSLVDSIPAGAKIQGTGLDNDSSSGPSSSNIYPDDQTLANDGYHASYSELPAKAFTVSYAMRLNNAGTFKVPATRIEAIYAPENFAELPNADITVAP